MEVIGRIGNVVWIFVQGDNVFIETHVPEHSMFEAEACIPEYSHQYFIELAAWGESYYSKQPAITEADRKAEELLLKRGE